MELNVNISGVVLLVIALASVAGGLVLYLGSKQVGWRAVGMSAVALGAGMVVVFAITIPVSTEGEAPEPVISLIVVPDESKEGTLTQQGPNGIVAGGTPSASLTYEGTVYYQDSFGSDEAAELNENHLELVGSTVESNTLDPNGGESLRVYRLDVSEADHVYTFAPGRSFLNEDGGTIVIEAEWIRWVASNQSAAVSSGMMVPRPRSVEELVSRSVVIVLGTVASVSEQKRIGYYRADGKPLPADENRIPVTDYEVHVESVLKGDGRVEDDGALVLRMYGHSGNGISIITPNSFTYPNPGDHLLFALGRNPDGTYGSGPEGLLNVDGEKVAYIDGEPFASDTSSEQFVRDIRDAAFRR